MNRADFIIRVRGCERRLYRVARTLLRSDADCEDAVQEALLKAWTRLATLRQEQYFETWLIRILINECKSLYRRRPRVEGEIPESLAAPAEDRSLMDALMNLPEKFRIPVELHYIEGYGISEISRMLRLPEGTVKWRLSRSRALLKDELGEEAQP